MKNQAVAAKTRQGSDPIASSLTKFTTAGIKTWQKMNKQLDTLNKNIMTMSGAKSKTTDFVRREDPMQKLIKEVDDLEELNKSRNKMLQKQQKDTGKGLLGLFGGLMGALTTVGGLGGFLLTGKKEFLFSMLKGITKYSPFKILLNVFDGALKKLAKPIAKGLGSVFKGIFKVGGKVFKPVGDIVTKNLDSFIKPLLNMGKGLTKVFKPIGKITGKLGLKVGGKSFGKAVLKKIPIVGGLLGLFFGIQRFKKGQVVEGMLEIASGIASVVPGVGTALSMGIDAFLLFNDFKGGSLTAGAIDGTKKIGSAMGKFTMSSMKKIAGLGPIVDFMEGTKMWKNDKLGALKKMGGAVLSITPVPLIGQFFGIVDHFIKDKGGVGGAAMVAGDALVGAVKHPIKTAHSIFSGIGKGVKNVTSGAGKALGNVASGAGKALGNVASGARDVGGTIAQAFGGLPSSIILDKNGANLWGLDPTVRDSLYNAADEYMLKTGKPLQINSAFRTRAEQAYLFKKFPGKAARPGTSRHESGMAVDIQTKGPTGIGNDASILSKHGFARPIPGREPWHFEYGRVSSNARSTIVDTPSEEEGDPVGIMNLPNQAIANKVMTNNKNQTIDLSIKTIELIADAMGQSFGKSLPSRVTRPINIENTMRG